MLDLKHETILKKAIKIMKYLCYNYLYEYIREEITMAFCKKCGSELEEGQQVCGNCGTSVNSTSVQSTSSGVNDNGGFGWGLLGFCFPIVGLILYLVWRQDKPNNAKAAGIGAIIGFVLGLLSSFSQLGAM
jgi:hypothetical protein